MKLPVSVTCRSKRLHIVRKTGGWAPIRRSRVSLCLRLRLLQSLLLHKEAEPDPELTCWEGDGLDPRGSASLSLIGDKVAPALFFHSHFTRESLAMAELFWLEPRDDRAVCCFEFSCSLSGAARLQQFFLCLRTDICRCFCDKQCFLCRLLLQTQNYGRMWWRSWMRRMEWTRSCWCMRWHSSIRSVDEYHTAGETKAIYPVTCSFLLLYFPLPLYLRSTQCIEMQYTSGLLICVGGSLFKWDVNASSLAALFTKNMIKSHSAQWN